MDYNNLKHAVLQLQTYSLLTKLETPAFFNCFDVNILVNLPLKCIGKQHKGKFMLRYKPFKISDEIRSE